LEPLSKKNVVRQPKNKDVEKPIIIHNARKERIKGVAKYVQEI